MSVRVIAFHLPQYHRIPENDLWWGEGFTEWTNVKRGKPFYRGHFQPRVPLNENYYDLAEDGELERQAILAQKYGVGGFCFYHYYFTGKKLLEKPIERLLQNSSISIPFCFCWANQSWGRTWYRNAGKTNVLLQQTYGNEAEWTEHFYYLLPFFKDQRYIKKDGCPLFLIYISSRIPRLQQMVKLWKRLAVENGFPGLHIVAMNTSYPQDDMHPCIDAQVDFEPMRTLRDLPFSIQELRYFRKKNIKNRTLKENGFMNRFLLDNVCSYDYLYRKMINRVYSNKKKVYLGAFPDWDNSARKDEDCIIVRGSNPKKFEKYLKIQLQRSIEMNSDYLFINAWNEWSEGAYLEPDARYGYAYLKAIRQAVKEVQGE